MRVSFRPRIAVQVAYVLHDVRHCTEVPSLGLLAATKGEGMKSVGMASCNMGVSRTKH